MLDKYSAYRTQITVSDDSLYQGWRCEGVVRDDATSQQLCKQAASGEQPHQTASKTARQCFLRRPAQRRCIGAGHLPAYGQGTKMKSRHKAYGNVLFPRGQRPRPGMKRSHAIGRMETAAVSEALSYAWMAK